MLVYIQLLAQALDVGIDCAVIADVIIAPDQGEQVVAGENASRRSGQGLKQFGFLACERKPVTIQRDTQRGQMD